MYLISNHPNLKNFKNDILAQLWEWYHDNCNASKPNIRSKIQNEDSTTDCLTFPYVPCDKL